MGGAVELTRLELTAAGLRKVAKKEKSALVVTAHLGFGAGGV
jgi:hypothetical protein